MQSELQEDIDSVFSKYTEISKEIYPSIKKGLIPFIIKECQHNLYWFLQGLGCFSTKNVFQLINSGIEIPYYLQKDDIKVYIYSSQFPYNFEVKNNEVLQQLILTEFNNVRYYAYQTKVLIQEQNSGIDIKNNYNSSNINNKEEKQDLTVFNKVRQDTCQTKVLTKEKNNVIDVMSYGSSQNVSSIDEDKYDITIQYPELKQIKKHMKQFFHIYRSITKHEIHDYSTPDISFHYNSNGSRAILFNLFCQREVVQKAISQIFDFDYLYYDLQTTYVLLIKEKTFSLKNFDELSQQYANNSIPLSTYLSIKFEEQKKHLNKLGVYQKKNLYQMSTIPNIRLRADLIELNECLDSDLEFDDQYQDQYCYAYYTQSSNPLILEGLIVGPQDTPYEGIVYTLYINIPEDYPDTPPNIYFNQNILHPNVSEKGKICLDILNEKWSPALTLQNLLISIVSLMFERNLDDVYNHYAKQLYLQNPLKLKEQILQQVIISGNKKIDINYKEIQRLTTTKKTNNLRIDQESENQYAQNEILDYSDCYYEDDE